MWILKNYKIMQKIEEIGLLLDRRRREHRYSVAEIARETGCSRPALNDLFSGKNSTIKIILAVCDTLNMKMMLVDKGKGIYHEED